MLSSPEPWWRCLYLDAPRNLSVIVQYGQPRSASTLQWYLLCSIARICAARVGPAPAPQVVCNPHHQQLQADRPTVWVVKVHEAPTLRTVREQVLSEYDRALEEGAATEAAGSAAPPVYSQAVLAVLARFAAVSSGLRRASGEQRFATFQTIRWRCGAVGRRAMCAAPPLAAHRWHAREHMMTIKGEADPKVPWVHRWCREKQVVFKLKRSSARALLPHCTTALRTTVAPLDLRPKVRQASRAD